MAAHTVAAMKRWSCQAKQLPPVHQIKHIHLYDFDNTLFATPLPNQKLWTAQTIGFLMGEDCFVNGGWWHDERILEATGQGLAKEEPRAWEGWWNEQIVHLVHLSMQQKDVLTILLTGRGQDNFSTIIKRMVAAKKLEFDLVCLKPKIGPMGKRFSSTMYYKQNLLEDLLYTYKDAEDIKVYEDRPKHVKGFRDFFVKINNAINMGSTPVSRKSVKAEVIHVPDNATSLDPVLETAEVQRMINSHNMALQTNENVVRAVRYQIKKTVFFTGYLLSSADTSTLLSLVPLVSTIPETELKHLANSILICPRPPSQTVLDKVGGLGAKQMWQLTGVGVHNNSVIAARATPMPSTATVFTENPVPFIVLACRKNAKPVDATHIQNWQPLPSEQQLVFETTVGEKVQLRIERENSNESEVESMFARDKGNNFNNRRNRGGGDYDDARPGDENRRNRYRGGNHNRGRGDASGHRNGPYPNRGGRNNNNNNNRGGGGGGGGNGGGRGKGRGGYKSLDDMNNGRGGYASQPDYGNGSNHAPGGGGYDSAYPPLGGRNTGGGGHDDSLMY